MASAFCDALIEGLRSSPRITSHTARSETWRATFSRRRCTVSRRPSVISTFVPVSSICMGPMLSRAGRATARSRGLRVGDGADPPGSGVPQRLRAGAQRGAGRADVVDEHAPRRCGPAGADRERLPAEPACASRPRWRAPTGPERVSTAATSCPVRRASARASASAWS